MAQILAKWLVFRTDPLPSNPPLLLVFTTWPSLDQMADSPHKLSNQHDQWSARRKGWSRFDSTIDRRHRVSFFMGYLFHSRDAGACPVSADLVRRANVRTITCIIFQQTIASVDKTDSIRRANVITITSIIFQQTKASVDKTEFGVHFVPNQ